MLLLLSRKATCDSSLRSSEFLDLLLCMPRKINKRSSLRRDSTLTTNCYKYRKSGVNIEKSQSLPNEIAIHFTEVDFTDFFKKSVYIQKEQCYLLFWTCSSNINIYLLLPEYHKYSKIKTKLWEGIISCIRSANRDGKIEHAKCFLSLNFRNTEI